MKSINLILVLLATFLISSCEDVIQVDLKTETPRLVIEASINWYKNTAGNSQKIKLSTTINYYNPVAPIVSGATVFITNSTNDIFNFIETPETGEYFCNNFVPKINKTYP